MSLALCGSERHPIEPHMSHTDVTLMLPQEPRHSRSLVWQRTRIFGEYSFAKQPCDFRESLLGHFWQQVLSATLLPKSPVTFSTTLLPKSPVTLERAYSVSLGNEPFQRLFCQRALSPF